MVKSVKSRSAHPFIPYFLHHFGNIRWIYSYLLLGVAICVAAHLNDLCMLGKSLSTRLVNLFRGRVSASSSSILQPSSSSSSSLLSREHWIDTSPLCPIIIRHKHSNISMDQETGLTSGLSRLVPVHTFTRCLPGDAKLSRPELIFEDEQTSHEKNEELVPENLMRLSRPVPDACWSFVKPEFQPHPRLIAVSDDALALIGLSEADAKAHHAEYAQVFSGNLLLPGK
jgi:hypothetical protein